MRFNIVLILFLVANFGAVRTMNLGRINPEIAEMEDEDDLSFVQRARNKIKKHPVATGIYLLSLTGVTGASIFAYKNNPEQFWNALQGFKEALGDFWSNLRATSAATKTQNKKNEQNGPGDSAMPMLKEYPIDLNDDHDTEVLSSDNVVISDNPTQKKVKKSPKVDKTERVISLSAKYNAYDIIKELYKALEIKNTEKFDAVCLKFEELEKEKLQKAKELNEKVGNNSDFAQAIENAEKVINISKNIKYPKKNANGEEVFETLDKNGNKEIIVLTGKTPSQKWDILKKEIEKVKKAKSTINFDSENEKIAYCTLIEKQDDGSIIEIRATKGSLEKHQNTIVLTTICTTVGAMVAAVFTHWYNNR